MSAKLTITSDPTRFDEVRKRLGPLTNLAARAGLFDPAQAVKGAAHEFGVEGQSADKPRIPKRPWLGPAADLAIRKAAAVAARSLGQLLDGAITAKETMAANGQVFEDAARARILDNNVGGIALDPATVKRKRDPRTLVDSGDMVDSLETRVGPDKAGS